MLLVDANDDISFLFDFLPSRRTSTPSMTTLLNDSTSSSTAQRVRAWRRRDEPPIDLSLVIDGKAIGKGTFATVYKVHSETTGETLAMKEVLLDPKHKNRELEIMLELTHPNIVPLKFYFTREVFTDRRMKNDYSCLLMELLPETFQSLIKRFHNSSLPFNEHREELQLYTFQMFRALAYLHQLGIAHRDIKPSNLLLDPSSKTLKLCDFGSAKRLLPNDVSVSYICSRYYRAPELIVGCTSYTPSIDIWAGACVMVEFYAGVPLFKGSNPNDQFVRIMSFLGEPTRDEIREMNAKSSTLIDQLLLVQRRREPTSSLEKRSLNDYLLWLSHSDRCWISLCLRLFQYSPRRRLTATEILMDEFYEDLRQSNRFTFDQTERNLFQSIVKENKSVHSLTKDVQT